MPTASTILRWSAWRVLLGVSLAVVAMLVGVAVSPAAGQGLFGYSPLLSLPRLEGDFKLTPIWMGIDNGKNTLPAAAQSWDLKRDFNMINSYWFLDVSGKLQTGPLAVRFACEPRNFVGIAPSPTHPTVTAEARLEFTGLRVGVDLDLFRKYRSRAGFNVDYYAYSPIFTEAIRTVDVLVVVDGIAVLGAGKKMIGESPVTLGAHALYSPMRDFYGWSPVFEVRVSWPWRAFGSTNVWDLELSAGLRTPPTVLGTVALKSGYRYTALSFKHRQLFNVNGVPTPSTGELDVALSGWFAELAYYY